MCVFLGRAMNFYWPQSRGGGIAPFATPMDPPLAAEHLFRPTFCAESAELLTWIDVNVFSNY